MTDRNTALKPCEDSGRASAERGMVILDGPDGIAVTMTAEAAVKTANSLHAAAELARRHFPEETGSDDEQGDDNVPR